jgi:P4 family phage/plasmid primase-like protien
MMKRLCVRSLEGAKPATPTPSDLRAVVMGLNKARADEYQDWIRVGMSLHHAGQDVSLWIEFSKQSKKFMYGECERAWRGFRKGALTERTLWYMLKQDDLALFKRLWKESSTRRDLLLNSLSGGHRFLAEYFVSSNLDDYLYDQHSGWWYLQDNNTWANSENSYPPTLNLRISRALYEAYDELRTEFRAKALEGNKADTEFYAGMLKSVLQMDAEVLKSSFIKSVMEFCASLYAELTQPLLEWFAVKEGEGIQSLMNTDPMLFAFKNCVYDFNIKATRPIKPQDFLSTTCGYAYPTRSERAIQEVEATLKTIWSRQGEYGDDGETYEAVMRLMATGLCGKKWLEVLVLLTGSGRNGKGLLMELVMSVFGNYYYASPSQLLTKTLESSTCADPTTFGLKAKRMTVMSEPEATEKLQEGRYKLLTGGDPITARPLYGGNSTFVIQCLLVMMCNNIPMINGMTRGGLMRLIVVPFPFEFNASPQSNREKMSNPDIKNRLCKSEEWRDAMWFILLDRFESIRGKGHGQIPLSALIHERTAEYVQENNVVGEWWAEHYVKDEDGQLLSRDVWSAYRVDTGDHAMGDKKFKQAMGFNLIDIKMLSSGGNKGKMGIIGWKRREE